MSQHLQTLEKTIEALSFSEKLWLLERIVKLLRTSQTIPNREIWADSIASMAEDPEIQAEIAQINSKFETTEVDGLNLS